jgi:ribonuclease HI
MYKAIADIMKFKPTLFNKIIFPSSPPWMWNIKLNTQLLELNKKISSTSTIRNNFSEIIEEKYPHHIKIFTDASKSPNGTGFAFIENNKTSMFKSPHETSIFSAESQAIQNAISHATTLVSEEILIISDSLSALLALKNPYPKNEIIQSIQEKLSNSTKKIEFLWVPSHTGISGNELADKAANEAIASPSSVLINKITFQDALIKINNLTKSHWQDSWEKISNTNKLKEIKTSIDPWKTPPSSSRHEEVVITRTRIGHSRLTHLHLITKEDSPTCELCDKALTIKHITLECPKFTNSRQILGNPSTMQQALGENNSKNIYNFFKNIGLAKLI